MMSLYEYKYYLYADLGNERVEREVTKEEWVAAERSAGFRGGKPGEPSTGGWSSGNIGGFIEYIADGVAQ